MKAEPERELQAERNMQVMMNASEAMSPIGVTVIGEASGPNPYIPKEAGE